MTNSKPPVTLIDYGIGNIRSVEKAFEAVGVDVTRTDDAEAIARAEKLVLPGVGAFGACADEIQRRGLIAPVLDAVQRGTPLLGVCVGMQLLFEASEEMGEHQGLGLLPGRVVRFDFATVTPLPRRPLKIPHMGWNTATATRPDPLLEGLPAAPYFYFVHSYHARVDDEQDVLAATDYGYRFPAIVRRENVMGVQFHPEKSARDGLQVLRNFAFS